MTGWAAAALVLVLAPPLLYRLLRRPLLAGVGDPTAGSATELPSVYHLAYLVGGAHRVAETALVTRFDAARPARTAAEFAVADALGAGRSFEPRGLRRRPVYERIGGDLHRLGLIASPVTLRRLRLAAFGYYTALLAGGIVLCVALPFERIGALVVATCLAGVFAFGQFVVGAYPPDPLRRPAGRLLLEMASRDAGTDLLAAVAVRGVGAHPDPEIRRELLDVVYPDS